MDIHGCFAKKPIKNKKANLFHNKQLITRRSRLRDLLS